MAKSSGNSKPTSNSGRLGNLTGSDSVSTSKYIYKDETQKARASAGRTSYFKQGSDFDLHDMSFFKEIQKAQNDADESMTRSKYAAPAMYNAQGRVDAAKARARAEIFKAGSQERAEIERARYDSEARKNQTYAQKFSSLMSNEISKLNAFYAYKRAKIEAKYAYKTHKQNRKHQRKMYKKYSKNFIKYKKAW